MNKKEEKVIIAAVREVRFLQASITRDEEGIINEITNHKMHGQDHKTMEYVTLCRLSGKPTSSLLRSKDDVKVSGIFNIIPVIIPNPYNSSPYIDNDLKWIAFIENLDTGYWEAYGIDHLLQRITMSGNTESKEIPATFITPFFGGLEREFPIDINDRISKESTDAMMMKLLTSE